MNRRYVLLFLIVSVIALTIHFAFIQSTPWDWDEAVYSNVANQAMLRGYPAFQIHSQKLDYYSFNPPLHFYVLATWFKLFGPSVQSGRVLSSLIAVLVVEITMLLVLTLTGNKGTSLLAGTLLAMDGWFSYTSLLVKMDTAAILIGTIGLCVYVLAERRQSQRLAMFAGSVIGMAIIYKHVAIIFLAAFMAHWIMTRRNHKLHFDAALAAGIVIAAYFAIMIVTVGDPFINAMAVQVRRTFGLQEARGLQFGLSEIIAALAQTYWAFAGSVILVAFATATLVNHVLRNLNRDWGMWIIACWVTAAGIVLAIIRLRNPHYLGYLIVPSAMLAAWQIQQWLTDGERRRNGAIILLTLFAGFSVMTIAIRGAVFSGTNALQSVQKEMRVQPANAKILSEEPICAEIQQPCWTLGNNQSQREIDKVKPDFVILYLTITQAPPRSGAIAALIAKSQNVREIKGWKEDIVIYKTPYANP